MKKRKAALADSFSSPKNNPIVNLNVTANLCYLIHIKHEKTHVQEK